jgi:hypothetical protein
MSLKTKAFIYRFFNIFGLRIYLAKREEREYLLTIDEDDDTPIGIVVGMWQANNGFTTIWTYKQPFFKALISKIKHAFTFRSYE